MSAAGSTLEHVGVPYEDPESLVEHVGARVAAAVTDGSDVYLSVDRRTARGFREHLGRVARDVVFPSPAEWPSDFVRTMRRTVRPHRRTLVLGQYTAVDPDTDLWGCENGANLVLGDLPLTLLCSCPHDAASAMLASMRTGHPALLVDGTVVPNPDYRAPCAASPVAGSQWGPTTSRLDFSAPADLRRLREHVTRAAETLGLRGEVVDEAVLAAHEAAVLAAGLPGYLRRDEEGDGGATVACVLEVRAAAGVLHCEILGPGTRSGNGDGWDEAAEDPLRIVRMFCDSALLHDASDVRSVRILRSPDTAA